MYTQDIAFAQGHTKKNRDVFHACLVYWVCMYILLLLYLCVEGVCVGCVCACALCVRACACLCENNLRLVFARRVCR